MGFYIKEYITSHADEFSVIEKLIEENPKNLIYKRIFIRNTFAKFEMIAK